jgi:hypothetical protein
VQDSSVTPDGKGTEYETRAIRKAYSFVQVGYLYGTIRRQLLNFVPREEKPLYLDEVEITFTLNIVYDAAQIDIVM